MGLGERRVSLSVRVAVKVGPYFDILEGALSEGNEDLASQMLEKISPYFHLLDDEHKDYYQGAQYALEENMIESFSTEDYYEPTEMDEWFSYDPDC